MVASSPSRNSVCAFAKYCCMSSMPPSLARLQLHHQPEQRLHTTLVRIYYTCAPPCTHRHIQPHANAHIPTPTDTLIIPCLHTDAGTNVPQIRSIGTKASTCSHTKTSILATHLQATYRTYHNDNARMQATRAQTSSMYTCNQHALDKKQVHTHKTGATHKPHLQGYIRPTSELLHSQAAKERPVLFPACAIAYCQYAPVLLASFPGITSLGLVQRPAFLGNFDIHRFRCHVEGG